MNFFQSYNQISTQPPTQIILPQLQKSKKIQKKPLELKNEKLNDCSLQANYIKSSLKYSIRKVINYTMEFAVQINLNNFNSPFIQLPDNTVPSAIRYYEKDQLVALIVNYSYLEKLAISVDYFLEIFRQFPEHVVQMIDSGESQLAKFELDENSYYEKLIFTDLTQVKIPSLQIETQIINKILSEQFALHTDSGKRRKYKNQKFCGYRLKQPPTAI